MKKTLLLIFFSFWSFFGFSQILELQELKNKRESYKKEMKALQKSLEKIDKEISFVENQIKNGVDNKEFVTVRAYAELLERPSIYAQTIMRYKSDSRVLLLDMDGDFVKVKTSDGEGYILSRFIQRKNKSPSVLGKSSYSSTRKTYKRNYYSASRSYIRGPRGGCYYINSNGNKTYVDRSQCN